ncbi:peptidase M20/M25/M40 family protein [Mycobacterium xenopi 4042]|uniref:Peptidase M20/M25/M40 family protein n=1 Tax=Mycobacterium xenopi 4042 TaxID=1299334 RepID=X8DY80_MYCXE|nr:peptidase M20/M25/M40 family protein [Mycobacterium xenopi 4042]
MLDLHGDPVELTAALVDIPSESRAERRIADEVEAALRAQTTGFEIVRNGNAVLARTHLGRPTRVLLAGHLDTVPVADNLPSRRDGDLLHGCGSADMKSGDAVFLHVAATVTAPSHDLTLVFYDCEEIESTANGLGRIERELPDWLQADVAILGEPTAGYIEAGCQGTLRAVVHATGAGPIRRDHGWATMQFTNSAPRSSGLQAIRRAVSRSMAAPTARGCRQCASTAASPATSFPTPRR